MNCGCVPLTRGIEWFVLCPLLLIFLLYGVDLPMILAEQYNFTFFKFEILNNILPFYVKESVLWFINCINFNKVFLIGFLLYNVIQCSNYLEKYPFITQLHFDTPINQSMLLITGL